MSSFRRSQGTTGHAQRDTTDRAYRKAGRTLLVVLGVYGLLVATHEGEFWPFSVYQMYSSAGRPWTRVMVRDVSSVPPNAIRWSPEDLQDLPGRPVSLHALGLARSQNDLSVFAEQTTAWSPARRRALQDLFRAHVSPDRHLLLCRVRGSLSESGTVTVEAEPIALITPDTLIVHGAGKAD